MMILDQAMNVMEKITNELKDAPPEKRDHLLKATLNLFEIGIDSFKKSPEFRDAFMRIHAEFFKYPESKGLIDEALRAYDLYYKGDID